MVSYFVRVYFYIYFDLLQPKWMGLSMVHLVTIQVYCLNLITSMIETRWRMATSMDFLSLVHVIEHANFRYQVITWNHVNLLFTGKPVEFK